MWQVIGHEWAVKLLKCSLDNGRVSHAYLLTGPPQIGKTTLALDFARALNCAGKKKPCGECTSCRKIAHGTHPDVRVIEGEGGTIKIDQIRDLQRQASLSPLEGRWKAYIIRQMGQATTEASNCLLKTLEEPPAHVILILTASNVQSLLPTVVSRCQVLNLHLLTAEEVQNALQEHWGVEDAQAELLARLSGGRLGWAVDASRDKDVLKRRGECLDKLTDLLGRGKVERFAYARKLSQDPERMREVLDWWLSWGHDLLLVREGSQTEITNLDRRASLLKQAERYGLGQIHGFLTALRAAVYALEHNANARLALEVLMLSLPRAKMRAGM
ncbi:MAG: DNA polymerase III subunit delta' [Chloroflexota bacterium]|nr:DNA polymerase III subunit delta' [Chloroflexota bacterium]